MSNLKTEVSIGSRVEMFVDEWLIEEREGVVLKATSPVKQEIVLKLDRSWEGGVCGYFTVIQSDGKVRLYYRAFYPTDDHDDRQLTCIAESEDGIHFERPVLGLYSYEGSTANNIVWKGLESHNFMPMRNCSSTSDSPKYLAIGGVAPRGTPWAEGMLYAMQSNDGIHWSRMQEKPVIEGQPFDSQNVVFWDPNRSEYRCYARYWTGDHIRAVHSSSSADFREWMPFLPNRYKEDAPLEHFYTNATVCCPGAEHMYLSFPSRFVPSRKKVNEHPADGVSDTVFMTSRDGLHWDRTFREAWVRPGPDRRNWTERSNMIAHGIVQLAPDEFSLYISEHYRWDDLHIRRLSVRKHGFASVHAGILEGCMTTRPFTFDGNRLTINYATSAAGSIRVELLDVSGRPLKDYSTEDMEPLFGDECGAVVRWQVGADVSRYAGQPVRLRFYLKDADLYSLQFVHHDPA